MLCFCNLNYFNVLRSVKGYTRLDKIRSEIIRKELEIPGIQDVRIKYKQNWINQSFNQWITTDSRNSTSNTNPEDEEVVDAPGKDGNASMPEQVERPNPWRKIIIIIILTYHASFIIFCYNQQTHNQYHNSLSVQSTLSCHHQTVYSQCLAKLHTYNTKRPVVLEPAARTLLQPNRTLPPTYSKPGMYNFSFTILINTNNTSNYQPTNETHYTKRTTRLPRIIDHNY